MYRVLYEVRRYRFYPEKKTKLFQYGRALVNYFSMGRSLVNYFIFDEFENLGGLAMGSGVAKVAGTPRKLIKNSSKIHQKTKEQN